ncbi:MAG: vanadium-dependent haloperoxidase [Gemmatimonadaceae bacterium]
MHRFFTSVLAGALVLTAVVCSDLPVGLDPSQLQIVGAKHFACAVRAHGSNAPLASPSWNALTRDLVAKYRTDPSARPYALVGLAQHAAVTLAEDRSSGRCPSSRAAVAAASVSVLTYLYSTESGALEARLEAQHAHDAASSLGSERDLVAGEKVGREAAALVIAYARTDGSDAVWTGTVPVGPGLWFSSAKPAAPPATPTLAQTRAWFLSSNDQFRPAPPPAFGSPQFLEALAEVKSAQTTRTPAQLELAKKWSLSGGTYRIQGYWNVVATELATQYDLRERAATHALALVNMAMHDATVACWDAKYTYWFIRPSQADPSIVSAIPLSNHPSYPSSHSCSSAAGATVLGVLFPAEVARLGAMADEVAMSRLYGGVHYRFDNEVGLSLGASVGRLAIEHDVDLTLIGATGERAVKVHE